MKLLTIATSFPYPPDDGTKIQIFERVRALSQRHDVTLLCIRSRPVPPDRIREMERYCRCVFIPAAPYTAPATRIGKARQMLRSIWLREPYYIHDRVAPEAQIWLEREVERQRFDVVEADGEVGGAYLRWPFRAVKVVILHSVFDTSARREIALERRAIRKWTTRTYNTLTRWHQARVVRAVDLCVTLTHENCRDLHRLYPEAHVRHCLSNGVDLEYFGYVEPVQPPGSVCFVGKMDYAPNVDAVGWFYRHVFPLVRQALPAVRFLIVGSHPTDAVRALARDVAVEVTGYVDDVRPYLRGGVMVLPMRMGGGILNKLLQGLALGVPVVATSRSLEGLSAVPNRDLLVADSADGLAAGIVRLATDTDLRLRLASNGRRYVEKAHQWTATVSRYEAELARLLLGGHAA
jgi:sugar transferase (PEP-CTERM/EpsH1 system associated)